MATNCLSPRGVQLITLSILMSNKPTTTDEYLASFSKDKRAVLEKLQAAIAAAAPGAEEGFSYGMPAFKIGGRSLIWFAAWKDHYSLYPMSSAVRNAYAADLSGYETSKGTIRFPANKPLPHGLVRKLVKARIAELQEGKK